MTEDRHERATVAEDDWKLLSRSGEDAEAFAELFRRHRDFVYRVSWGFLLRRDLAEDATQEVFIRLVQKRERLHERARLRTLLYGFAVNVARELRRAGSREVAFELELQNCAAEEGAPSALVSDVWRLLPKLPRRQREVVVLRLMEGLSTRETASALGCGEGAVKTHLHRATRSLRQLLTDSESWAAPRSLPETGRS